MFNATYTISDPRQSRKGSVFRWDSSGVTLIASRSVMAASAMLIGVIAVLLGRMFRVYYLEPTGLQLAPGDVNLRPLFDFCFSYALCKLFGATFGNSFRQAGLFRLAGVWITILSMHNAVWWYPEWAAAIYSPQYVEEVKETTQPDSVFAVTTFVSFSDLFKTEEEPVPEEAAPTPRETPSLFMRADEGVRLEGFRNPLEQTGRDGRFIQAK